MEWVCAVDRVEGKGAIAIAVRVGDDGGVEEVPKRALGRLAVEGAVLRIPLQNGTPDWAAARRDRVEEARRLTDLTNRVKRVKARDPGGDIEL